MKKKLKKLDHGLVLGSVIQADSVSEIDIDLDKFEDAIPAEVLAHGYQPEIVHGKDDRQPVVNTQVSPYKAICKLFITTADGRRVSGTGYLTAANKVYTACLL